MLMMLIVAPNQTVALGNFAGIPTPFENIRIGHPLHRPLTFRDGDFGGMGQKGSYYNTTPL
jgi:hypothetical protein